MQKLFSRGVLAVLMWFAFLSPLTAQTPTGTYNPQVITFPGTPTGVCDNYQQALDVTTGIFYSCNPSNRTWVFASMPKSYTVATLPAANAVQPGTVVAVTDSSVAGSCTVGGGTALALCRSNGSMWQPIGDGGSGGGGGGAPSQGGKYDLQVADGSGAFLSGKNPANSANVGVNGNVAVKNFAADGVQYVSPGGNDSNDGLSPGTAKLTGFKACVSLPGGDGVITCGSGHIFFATNSVWCTSGGTSYGIRLMASGDPNYASPPTCWLKLPSPSGQQLHISGITGGGNGVAASLAVTTGNDRNNPGIWVSSSFESLTFDNISTQYQGRGVVVGECSNNTRTGSCNSTGITFNNVNPQLDQVAGTGPDWDILYGYWIWINHSSGQANTLNSVGDDKRSAMLINFTGIMTIRDFRIGGDSGIKIYNSGGAGNGAIIDYVDLDSSDGMTCDPVVWIKNTGGAQYELNGIANADCANTPSYAVEVDAGEPTDVSVRGAQGAGANTKGPMIVLDQASISGLNQVSDPLVNGQSGFYVNRVLGETDVARKSFVPQPVQYVNVALTPANWINQGNVNQTVGVSDPTGGSNGVRLSQSTGSQSGMEWYTTTRTFSTGDWVIWGGWVRSPDGTFTGGIPMQEGFSSGSCTASSSSNYPFSTASYPATTTNWQWVYGYIKINIGGSCTFGVNLRTDTTHRNDSFGLVANYITTGTWDDQTVFDYINNLNSHDPSCAVGTICPVAAPFNFLGGGTFGSVANPATFYANAFNFNGPHLLLTASDSTACPNLSSPTVTGICTTGLQSAPQGWNPNGSNWENFAMWKTTAPTTNDTLCANSHYPEIDDCANTGGMQVASDGVHATLLGLSGNTTLPATLPLTSAGFIGPNSASFTSWFGQLPSTAPSGTPLICGAPISNVATCSWQGNYSCTEIWGGTGAANALQSGDDAISNNSCYNDSGATRTITAVKCRNDNASNTSTVNPTFGSAGTGTTVLSGALTCGSSYAYSSSGTVSNASWTTGTGIDPAMGGTLTGTSIAMIVEYHY